MNTWPTKCSASVHYVFNVIRRYIVVVFMTALMVCAHKNERNLGQYSASVYKKRRYVKVTHILKNNMNHNKENY